MPPATWGPQGLCVSFAPHGSWVSILGQPYPFKGSAMHLCLASFHDESWHYPEGDPDLRRTRESQGRAGWARLLEQCL